MPGDPHSGSKVWKAPDREIGKPGENRGKAIVRRDVQPTAAFHDRENRSNLQAARGRHLRFSPPRVLQMLDQPPDKYASRFAVQTGSRIQIVLAEDVEWIGAAGDYVGLHVSGRSHLLRETMAALEQRLDPAKFLRIHRSRIVNTGSIVEL